jgi:hypothetical protein
VTDNSSNLTCVLNQNPIIRIQTPPRYRATLPDGTAFDEAAEGSEVEVVVDDEMVRGRSAYLSAGRVVDCGDPNTRRK